MSYSEHEKKSNAIINEMMASMPRQSWREVAIMRVAHLGLSPTYKLELRVTAEADDGDVFALAKRGINAFFTAFSLYPMRLAAHPSVVSMFEASETIFKAKHAFAEDIERFLGDGFEATPIHIEADESLDIRTIAVRFSMDFEEYKDALISIVKQGMKEMKR